MTRTLISVLFFLQLGLISSCMSQIESDQALKNIQDNLPAGWTMTLNQGKLILERTEPVWIAHGNWINGPHDVWNLKTDENWIKEQGKEHQIRFTYTAFPTDLQAVNAAYDPNPAPAYYSANYKLMRVDEEWTSYEPQYNAIWPAEMESEIYQVEQLLGEHLRNER